MCLTGLSNGLPEMPCSKQNTAPSYSGISARDSYRERQNNGFGHFERNSRASTDKARLNSASHQSTLQRLGLGPTFSPKGWRSKLRGVCNDTGSPSEQETLRHPENLRIRVILEFTKPWSRPTNFQQKCTPLEQIANLLQGIGAEGGGSRTRKPKGLACETP